MRLRQVLGRMVKVTNPVHAVVGGPETEDVTLGMSSEATAVSKQYEVVQVIKKWWGSQFEPVRDGSRKAVPT